MQAIPIDELIDHYRSSEESSRLDVGKGRVELLRTQALLRARLGSHQTVLDVGGAAGVHAEWLRADGHDVAVVDLVPHHVEQARARGLPARVGDARSLPYDDASFDVVLLLGPLYHLPNADDRATALGEARRVLRPGGLVAAAACSRLSVALDALRTGGFGDLGLRGAARRIATTGRDDSGYGRGLFWFHTADELRGELASAAFDEVMVHGVEGPAWPLLDADRSGDDALIAHVVEVAALADGEPAAPAASAHLLAFGTR